MSTGEHVLLTPLGLSPGAISGLALALLKGDNGKLGNFPISRVITVGTSHSEVKKVDQILKKLFHEVDIAYESHFIPYAELREEAGSLAPGEQVLDMNRDSAAVLFMLAIGRVLDRLAEENHTIHIGVTSGRSGMGALAALATNVYGADHLWHFWVSSEIEEMGRLDRLPKPLRLSGNKYLDPTLVAGSYQVVPLPFLNLRPYHPILKQYYRRYRTAVAAGQRVELPPDVAPVVALLWQAGSRRLEDIFPAELPVAAVDKITAMVSRYPALDSEEEQEALRRQLLVLLGDHHVMTEETIRRMELLLRTGASPETVLEAGLKGEDPEGFWQTIAENKAAVLGLGITATDMLINAVSFWMQATGRM